MAKLDREEKEILKDFETGRMQSTASKDKLFKLREAAKITLRKNKRINIRISERDLLALKIAAAAEGIPYQTMIASILHKFNTGKIYEPLKR